MTSTITLSTPRLSLRLPIAADAERMCALAGNWNVARMTAKMPHPYRIEDAHEFIAHAPAAAEAGEALHLAIVLNGAYIGGIGIGPRNGKPSLGYWLGEPFWGQGLTGEAALAVTRYFFTCCSDPVLTSGYLDENVASGKIQTRLGFAVVRPIMHHSRARNGEAPGVETELTRERFFALHP